MPLSPDLQRELVTNYPVALLFHKQEETWSFDIGLQPELEERNALLTAWLTLHSVLLEMGILEDLPPEQPLNTGHYL